ncbi:MAG: hypothetical protein M1812_003854 [Candelaria pacifica]|nr:MAG: hypothetical protein M1812_003854 [Candelaria pacifica]
MASSTQRLDPQMQTRKVKTLVNVALKNILRAESLASSGVKSVLQARIIDQLENYARAGDTQRFNQLSRRIESPNSDLSPSSLGYQGNSAASPVTPTQPLMTNHAGRPLGSTPGVPRPSHAPAGIAFKDSPFFTVLEPLTNVVDCPLKAPVMPANRHTINTKLVLTDTVVERLQDPTLRIMIYCTSDNALLPYTRADVAFPHQIEIKVNLDEIRSNLRGLKNKPGTTRPADITNLVRKRSGYENSIVMTYALTQKKFSLLVNLVRQHSVEELVGRLKRGKHTTKDQVIREMLSKAHDTDIVATSTVMSLKCPISTLRIDLPCRSTICSHNQCFDASSFLQLQEQAPTWTCPVCNKIILFEALAVDQYVDDILKVTPKSVEQVTIEPNGTWSQNAKPASPPRPHGAACNNSDDDDLVEIKGMRVTSLKNEAISTPSALTRTPPLSSREPSTASATSRPPSGKRPIEQVIDLTFSDDEDEEPIRAPKRQTTLNSLSSVPDSRSGIVPANDRSQTNGVNLGNTRLLPVTTSNPGWGGYNNHS